MQSVVERKGSGGEREIAKATSYLYNVQRRLQDSCDGATHADLPLADVLHPLPKRSLKAGAELQGVAADLDDVVDESTHGRQRKRRGEEHHVAKLDKHFLVVLKGVLYSIS